MEARLRHIAVRGERRRRRYDSVAGLAQRLHRLLGADRRRSEVFSVETFLWEDTDMLRWSLAFLIFALIAALLGFSGLAFVGVEVAQVLAFVFIVLFLISLVFGSLRGGEPPVPPA
jgi:uncharacterized membrane protein YtjA (UPF0391 family)